MSKKPAVAKPQTPPSADPTLRVAEVTVKGRKLTLCFDLRELARAEAELKRAGHAEVDLFRSLPVDTVESVFIVFACAVRRFHPEIGFDEAVSMLNFSDIYNVRQEVVNAWAASMPDPEPEKTADPTNPGQ